MVITDNKEGSKDVLNILTEEQIELIKNDYLKVGEQDERRSNQLDHD